MPHLTVPSQGNPFAERRKRAGVGERGCFFLAMRAGVARIGARRSWRVALWVDLPLLVTLIVVKAMSGNWFAVGAYVLTGGLVLYSLQHWLRRG